MELLNKILFKGRSNKTTTRKQTLEDIKHHLHEFYCRMVPFSQCLSKTGTLSAELITNHYSEGKVSDEIYDIILLMFVNYYVVLHIDNYSGDRSIDKDFIYDHVAKISDKAISEIVRNRNFKSYDRRTASLKSRDFARQLVDVYYISAIGGCLKYVTFAIYSALQSVDKKHVLSKTRIENIIRSVQAEKFLTLFHSDQNRLG